MQSKGKLHLYKSNSNFALYHFVNALSRDDFVERIEALKRLPEILEHQIYAESSMDLKIVEKAANLFRRYNKRLLTPRANEESLLLQVFHILSTYSKAAEQMANETFLITHLYNMIERMHSEQHIAASILKNLSLKSEALSNLAKIPKHFRSIKAIFNRELCTTYLPEDLWTHIYHMLEIAPVAGIKHHFMEIFLNRIKLRLGDFHRDSMKCLALLLTCKEGQDKFFVLDGLKIFYNLLHPKNCPLNDYKETLLVLKNALRTNHFLIEACAQYNDFPDILTNLAKVSENVPEQLLCLQLLNSLNTRNDIRTVTLKRCLKDITRLKTLSRECEYYKIALLCSLNRNK